MNPTVEFKTILQCFNLVLKRLGKGIWLGEGPEYPQVVFDAFKDNPSLSTLLCEKNLSAERNPWFFSWLPEFLLTIRDQPIYSEVVAKVTDFMCGELQHERFGDARPIVMACAARVSRRTWSVRPPFTLLLAVTQGPKSRWQ